MDANSSILDPEESSEEERGLASYYGSAVFNLTRARFPKWKELKSSKTFWLLVFSTRSTIYACFLKLEGGVWPRVQAWLNLSPPSMPWQRRSSLSICGLPSQVRPVSTMPGHYYSVIFDGSTRQDKAIAITVRVINEQWEIMSGSTLLPSSLQALSYRRY